jgi:hypothetical protein
MTPNDPCIFWDMIKNLCVVKEMLPFFEFTHFDVTTSYVSIYRANNQKSGDVTCELQEEFADVT